MTVGIFLTITVFSLICGAIIAVASSVKQKKTSSFILSLIVLPAIVCAVITMVNGNIGTGIAVAGAFSLIRFRSAQGRASEIAEIFLAMTAGITCAAGFIAIAVLFTLLISTLIFAFSVIPLGAKRVLELRITIPESIEFTGAFDDIFEKYTESSKLTSVRTSDMGSLYKLEYEITVKKDVTLKKLIDEIRTRNGNLEVKISEPEEKSDSL